MKPTPGVVFLAHNLFYVSALFSAFYFVRYILSTQLRVDVPTWLFALACMLSVPAIVTFKILAKEIRDKRAAKALGCRLAPVAKGKWIANVDILKTQLEVIKNGYPADGLDTLVDDNGPVVNLRVLWADMIVTVEPDHIKLILATDFNNYVKGPEFDYSMKSVLGSGVFNSDGEMWKFHRSITRPHFNREKITDFDLFDRHAETAIAAITQRLREGYGFDMQDLLSRITIDTATEFLFGSCVHTLSAGLPYPHNAPASIKTSSALRHTGVGGAVDPNSFASAFSQAQVVIANRERKGWVWPLFEVFEDATRRHMAVVDGFVEPIVREAVEKYKSREREREGKAEEGKGEGGEDETLLDHLVKFTSDPKILKDETLNILIAGRDTTAATTTFIVYFLAAHPAVCSRLRAEVLEHVGETRRPTLEDVKGMRYLRAVINETLRLYPVVPFNVRTSVEPAIWPSPDPTKKPIYIPAKTRVPYSVLMMHRRKDLWGSDAELFDPDRFLDARLQQYLLKNSFKFLPFNAGPRICLGQQFAYNEMSYVLIKLLQRLSSFALAPECAPPGSLPPKVWSEPGQGGIGNGKNERKRVDRFWPKSHLTMYSEGGLWITATEAVPSASAGSGGTEEKLL